MDTLLEHVSREEDYYKNTLKNELLMYERTLSDPKVINGPSYETIQKEYSKIKKELSQYNEEQEHKVLFDEPIMSYGFAVKLSDMFGIKKTDVTSVKECDDDTVCIEVRDTVAHSVVKYSKLVDSLYDLGDMVIEVFDHCSKPVYNIRYSDICLCKITDGGFDNVALNMHKFILTLSYKEKTYAAADE